MSTVRIIEPTVTPQTERTRRHDGKKRVAAYARVSTDKAEQLTSYEAQVAYYTGYIKSRPEWEYVDVYTDEGISGTSMRRRAGFRRMINDALSGNIDLIITKSVSRFARNTVDTLSTIRALKEVGCECYFEKENIYTFDGKGEVLLTIMSSLAQEESRSISQNVTWGVRRSMAKGKVNIPFKNFLGYERGEEGEIRIVEAEAAIVRRIYNMYLQGESPYAIGKKLESDGVPSPAGKSKWYSSTVTSILKNEKYRGDALLQKTYTVDFLTKRKAVNHGEVRRYYVEGSHPPIISAEIYEQVQKELSLRAGKSRLPVRKGRHIFSNMLYCADCGGLMGRRVWHPHTASESIRWVCNNKYKGGRKCSSPNLREDELLAAFASKSWLKEVERMTVYSKDDIRITWKSYRLMIPASFVSAQSTVPDSNGAPTNEAHPL